MLATTSIREAVATLRERLIADRRHFHQHPELGFQEHHTAAYVADRLRSLGIETHTGVAGTGVVGIIRGGQPGRTVLLRADLDALPLTEETGAEYASLYPGVHHACGHDGHTAIMLAVAELLDSRRTELHGNVKLVFQPAEEGPGGAQPMIDAGVMRDPDVDACFGLHISTNHPLGTLVVQPGALQASSDEFDLHVEGVGGHGAAPHQTVDAVAVGAAIVTEIQRIVSREVDPLEAAVVTVGSFHAGTKHNIIARRAELHGTIRALSAETRAFLKKRVREIAAGISEAARAHCDVVVREGYPVVVNDERMAAFARSVAETVALPERVIAARPIMGAEDMSYFLNAAPGCFIFLGARNEAKGFSAPHHSPLFDFDEDCMPLGVELLTSLALAYLDREAEGS